MTPTQFIIWFKGFSKAANSYNITPKQWEDIQKMLNSVNVQEDPLVFSRHGFENTNWTSNNTAKIFNNDQKQQLND